MNESVGSIETFRGSDLSDLCEATEAAILDGDSFGWVKPPPRATGFKVLWLDVREARTAAIKLYESLGFVHWGTNPNYACIGRKIVAGRHYYKKLS